jgi:murein DD-endopeptidase MepM/ murein hydrolase activator NlpD
VTSRLRSSILLLSAALLASCQPSSDAGPAHARDLPLPRDATTFEAVVPENATLESLLSQQLPSDLTRSVVEAVRGVFNPRDLRAEHAYRITRSLDGLFREFRYDIDADTLLRVVFRNTAGSDAASLDAAVVPVPKEFEPAAVEVDISPEHASLIDAFNAEGENIQLPLALSEVFGGEVDFNADLRQGDRVEVLFDRATRDGEFVGYGDVKAAILTNGRRTITAVRYEDAEGHASFYSERGRSLRRQFLKSPLPFTPRVTSGFSYNRFHPVHGSFRPHLGVDYGAPFGTPVNSVASGVIVAAEWAGEAGRMVRIRHTGGYQTAYLHLSSFAPGIHPGVRVEQGQLIGRVGQTGTATGPHLDYRIIKNGVYVNPLTEFSKMPEGEPLPADALEEFARQRDELLGELRTRLASSPGVSAASLASR